MRRYRPKLVVKYDDSILDNQNNFVFDSSGTIFLYNYGPLGLTNIVSGTNLLPVTGSNCILLKLTTHVTGVGDYTLTFTGSQVTRATQNVAGVYSASFLLNSSNANYRIKLLESGSAEFTQVWSSVDNTIGYLTSSGFVVNPINRTSYVANPTTRLLTVTNIESEYSTIDVAHLRLFVQDTSERLKLKRVPHEAKSKTFREAYYSIRDTLTGHVPVSFDKAHKSTRLSTDSNGMYFTVYMENLDVEGLYTIDILVRESNSDKIFRDVSTPFRVK